MIALIDYGMGNLSSVKKAFDAIGAIDVKITSCQKEILKSSKIILPGVGNFGDGIRTLKKLGLDKTLLDCVNRGVPLFGICLGLQLLFDSSEEAPGERGLGIIKGTVVKFDQRHKLKIPQIGWNSVSKIKEGGYLSGIESGDFFYFVHSYYVVPEDKSLVALTTSYGEEFCSCIVGSRIFATQFHPEKSQDKGLTLIKNFVGYTL